MDMRSNIQPFRQVFGPYQTGPHPRFGVFLQNAQEIQGKGDPTSALQIDELDRAAGVRRTRVGRGSLSLDAVRDHIMASDRGCGTAPSDSAVFGTGIAQADEAPLPE
jgi:hypothetical protein